MTTPKYPPRVRMTYRKGGRPQVSTQPAMDCENHVYISELEVTDLIAQARREAKESVYSAAKMVRFRAKRAWANGFEDAGRQMDTLSWDILHLNGGNDSAMKELKLIDSEYSLLYPEDNTAQARAAEGREGDT